MLNVLTAYTIIFVVIGTGSLLSARGVIGEGKNRLMLNQIAFYAATPALIFSSVAESDPGHFTSPVLLVITVSTAAIGLIYIILSRLFFKQDVPTTTMGAAASGYYNSVNMGLPVSIYVLGEATHVIPTLIVQMALFTPIILAFLGSDQDSVADKPKAVSFLLSVRSSLVSPVVLASFLGLIVALTDFTVPAPIMEPLRILGGASIPMILMSFGASLTAGGVLTSKPDRPGTLAATAIKVVGMPLVSWLLCLAFGVEGDLMYAAVILSALPTAQNVYNYAATYRRGEVLARDTVFLTTFLSMPAMLIIALLFGR
jgi:hypothetical protein